MALDSKVQDCYIALTSEFAEAGVTLVKLCYSNGKLWVFRADAITWSASNKLSKTRRIVL